MKRYLRVMLGAKSVHAEECYKGNFIGVDFEIYQDLTGNLPDNWRDFNHNFIPVWLKVNPTKSKIAAGLACGALWTLSKGIKIGDIVLCPDGRGGYYVGEVLDNYSYHSDMILPHRRTVRWYPTIIDRTAMTPELKNSTGSIGTIGDISKYADEIENLIGGKVPPTIISTDETVEDASTFALEKHLEDFLVSNWNQSELGKQYDIFEEDGELVGQQYPSDTGPIDILAISKDKKTILVVELKKGRASDNVVGQIQRYMGYVKEELAEPHQTVKGVIIALEDDLRIKRALSVTQNIDFFRYQISFKLFKVS
jgi:restriction system protein